MNDLPAPLVPENVDLRGYPFTPIFRARLFGSSFHARVTDAEWRAGVTLWLKSWDQVPAGTLPTDDIDLCRLAELGRDLKTWAKVKVGALHGWIKCSDGRLHHSVVAEGVLEAWERRARASAKGKAGAAKKWGTGNAPATTQASEIDASAMPQPHKPDGTGIAQAMPGHSNRQGQGERQRKNPEANASADVDVVDEDPRARLFRIGKTILVSFGIAEKRTGALIGQWLKAKPDPAGLLLAIQFARDNSVAEPVAYVSAIVHGKGQVNGSRRRTIDDVEADLLARAGDHDRESPEGAISAEYSDLGSDQSGEPAGQAVAACKPS